MNVVPLTVAIGLCLVFTFVLFFLHEQARAGLSGPEHDSLLPLAEETPRPAAGKPGHGCGCRRSAAPPQEGHDRSPCAACRKKHG